VSDPSTVPALSGPVMCIVGARPNFMKMAPILRALAAHQPPLPALLVHTGQHYDADMSDRLFEDLRLPRPDINLEVGSASHAVQTAEVMRRFEPALDEHRPSVVVVVGDVNSTLACTLVAVKKGVPVAHVEAGLRSYDRKMPEEINRVLTDQIADRLYTTERSAEDNLRREGVPAERVCFAGNVMIDSLLSNRAQARAAVDTLTSHGIDPAVLQQPHGYGVVTLHRPANVDDPAAFAGLVTALNTVAERIPLVFPAHPRTKAALEAAGLHPALRLLPPAGYLDFVALQADAALVLTDSGGVQEETTMLGVPCLTLRDNTERPITVTEGTNRVIGRDPADIVRHAQVEYRNRGRAGAERV
jgi:UDP-N-acetylglucosamine 2-epimerase (non-hydrolysing)